MTPILMMIRTGFLTIMNLQVHSLGLAVQPLVGLRPHCNIKVKEVISINEVEQIINIQFQLGMMWFDSRLQSRRTELSASTIPLVLQRFQ